MSISGKTSRKEGCGEIREPSRDRKVPEVIDGTLEPLRDGVTDETREPLRDGVRDGTRDPRRDDLWGAITDSAFRDRPGEDSLDNIDGVLEAPSD